MLPVWVNDLATVVTLVTGVPVIAGWVISKAGPLRPPVAKPHRSANTGNMVRDALHEAVSSGLAADAIVKLVQEELARANGRKGSRG